MNGYTFPLDKLRPVSSCLPGKTPAVIVSCGSFNPVTFLHLRLFEVARDALRLSSEYDVLGGYFSPVNDRYTKKDLVPSVHRVAMCRLAAAASDWIMTDPWESLQSEYQRTRVVLEHIERRVNGSVALSAGPPTSNSSAVDARQLDGSHQEDCPKRIRVLLLCGSDLLESFMTPGVWNPSDVLSILRDFGVVCIQREGVDPFRIIHESDLLSMLSKYILVFREWILNDVSATEVRRHIRRGLSIRYLTPDPVVSYLVQHGLYRMIDEEKLIDSLRESFERALENKKQ
eukprot:ANDGO_03687.mRNA.1 Nicotinamide/nicotinic acid mononucleotide adenylyltransferase